MVHDEHDGRAYYSLLSVSWKLQLLTLSVVRTWNLPVTPGEKDGTLERITFFLLFTGCHAVQ